MNNKFFNLPIEKQSKIINSAYKVFSQNDYKKAPMSEIALTAGISKSLLFHYFDNKKDLYFYLWKHSMMLTANATRQYKVTETDDFSEMLTRSNQAKCSIMRSHPYIYAFTLKAYYEQNEEIKNIVQKSYLNAEKASEEKILKTVDISKIRNDVNILEIYRIIYFTVEGYMLQKYRNDDINGDAIEREIQELIEH